VLAVPSHIICKKSPNKIAFGAEADAPDHLNRALVAFTANNEE